MTCLIAYSNEISLAGGLCLLLLILCTLVSIPEQGVGCYCCLLEQERSPEQPDADGNGYVICFMGGSEKGLNLYPLCTAD